jgi:toxin-antitoxin system PIN domain toxin
MILIDANILLHAYNTRSKDHETARRWLEARLSGTELVRFAWLTIWAFLRISTNSRAFEHPLSMGEAREIVTSWLERPNADVVDPDERHWDILGALLDDGQTVGPLVMDAVLAAVAIEHGATLCTTDRDFSRFNGLAWTNPLQA